MYYYNKPKSNYRLLILQLHNYKKDTTKEKKWQVRNVPLY